MSYPSRIAVIGAGISGLTAAWYATKRYPEAHVFVLDERNRIGGVIQTLTSPHLIECGADNFATLLPDALELVRDMGLESEFITPNRDYRIAQVVARGKLVPIPNGFSLMQPTRMGAILSTPILSVRGKLRVLAEYFVPRRNADDDESVASFATRRLGKECFERLVEPIVGGIFTAKAETLSMQAAMPQFVAMEREHGSLIRAAFAKRRSQTKDSQSARAASGARYDQFLAPRQGMSWWLEQLAKPIQDAGRLRLNTQVVSLQRRDQSWEVHCVNTGTSTRDTLMVDAVLLAVPSYQAATLLKPHHQELAKELDGIPYATSAIAVLAVKRSEIRPEAMCFGSIAPTIERRNCLAISLSSEKYAGRCPTDTVLARVFMGGAVRPELLEHTDEQLLAMARDEVKDLFGPITAPSWERVVRWSRAMPQYLVGHNQRVTRIRSWMTELPNIALTGNAYDGVGIPQCVRGAKNAVASLEATSHA